MSSNIEELLFDETAIAELPSSIKYSCRLVTLSLRSCSSLKTLSSNTCELKSLKPIDLSGCSKLDKLPKNIAGLKSLVEFKAERTSIREVPSSARRLKNLEILSFEGCKGLDSRGLLPSLSVVQKLTHLRLNGCGITVIPESSGHLSSLNYLCLGRNGFESLPGTFINLSKLLLLDVSYCNKLQVLPELPLTCIDAHSCKTLDALPNLSIESVEVKGVTCATHWYMFPWNEIPEWCHFQTTGCFLTTELKPGWFRNNFVGVVMCAVVAFQDYQDDDSGFYVRCKCTFKCKDGRSGHLGYGTLYEQGSYCRDSLRDINLEHVFMGFDFFMYPPDNGTVGYKDEVSFQFHLQNSKSCVVKKCGVHLMYGGDRGQIGAINSSLGDEDREEPQPKRLKFL